MYTHCGEISHAFTIACVYIKLSISLFHIAAGPATVEAIQQACMVDPSQFVF